MAEYTLITPTPVDVNTPIPYNNVVCKGGCDITHRNGSGIINIKGGSSSKPKKFYVQFHGNITNVTGFSRLGIFLDGELLPETQMYVVAAAATDILSVDCATEICSTCSCSSLSVQIGRAHV